MSFDEIWQQVQSLTQEERGELRRLLDEQAPLPSVTSEEQFKAKLRAEGLLSSPTPQPLPRPVAGGDRITMTGKPLSETIIEERG